MYEYTYAAVQQVAVGAESGAGVSIGGRRLTLLQFHWHRSSEHTLDGRHVAMELHLVHRDDVTGALHPGPVTWPPDDALTSALIHYVGHAANSCAWSSASI